MCLWYGIGVGRLIYSNQRNYSLKRESIFINEKKNVYLENKKALNCGQRSRVLKKGLKKDEW